MKQFIAVLSLLSLLVMPAASFAAKPNFVLPPVKGGAKINFSVTSTHASGTKRGDAEENREIKNGTTGEQEENHATSTPKQHLTFVLTGEIMSVNASSSSLTVKIKTIDQLATRRSLRGQTVTIAVDAGTTIRRPGQKTATLADLAQGYSVTIKGKADANNVFTATSIVAAGKPGKAKGIMNVINNIKNAINKIKGPKK